MIKKNTNVRKKTSTKKSKPTTYSSKKTPVNSRAILEPSSKKKFPRSLFATLGRKKNIQQKPVRKKIANVFVLLKISVRLIRNNWKLFGGITIIYIVLTFMFVSKLQGTDIAKVQELLQKLDASTFTTITTTTAIFASLFENNKQQAGSSFNQSCIFILITLVTIWSLRQTSANKIVRIRDAFYKGTYPLVQFVLVLLTIGFQLIPMAIASWLYEVVIIGGIAGNGLEFVLWLGLIIGLLCVSLYLVISSIFGLFIVTLPDMTPLKSLRSARQLVKYRRLEVLRKVIFLPILLFLLAICVMFPVIIFLPAIAEALFYVLSLGVWIFTLTYIYNLYRELLN